MRHIVIRGLPGRKIFSHISHKRQDFQKKKYIDHKCVFWFSPQVLSETFVILGRIQEDIIINLHRSSCKVSVILGAWGGVVVKTLRY
jgi:hypothetical protein